MCVQDNGIRQGRPRNVGDKRAAWHTGGRQPAGLGATSQFSRNVLAADCLGDVGSQTRESVSAEIGGRRCETSTAGLACWLVVWVSPVADAGEKYMHVSRTACGFGGFLAMCPRRCFLCARRGRLARSRSRWMGRPRPQLMANRTPRAPDQSRAGRRLAPKSVEAAMRPPPGRARPGRSSPRPGGRRAR
jgi:hypothetical protein